MLCDNAVNQGVDPTMVAEPVAIYNTKCLPTNILVLQSNLNTDQYFTREAEKIQIEKIRKNTPPTTPTPGGDPTPPKPYPESITLRLDTRAVNLDSEAAVDAYLARLKEKIMAKINDNKIVTITK